MNCSSELWNHYLGGRRIAESGNACFETCDGEIGRDLTEQLQRIAGERDASLTELLLAGFYVLLFRHTAESELMAGCRVVVPGSGIEVVPIRCRLADAQPFAEVVKQVQAAVRHFETGPGDVEHVSPVTFEMGSWPDHPQADLSLVITLAPHAGMRVRFRYNARRYRADFVQWMSSHYGRLLSSIAERPTSPIQDLAMTTIEEEALLRKWGLGPIAPPEDNFYHETFEAHAAARPEAPAVVFEGGQLTYAELSRRSNQLAHYLRALGVGPDIIVGLRLDCSVELVIATLAVLKAGGAILYLEPADTMPRLSVLLDQANPALILTKRSLGELPSQFGRQVDLENARLLAGMPDTRPDSRVHHQNLAFVYFTSGSTGLPKAVMTPHGRSRGLSENDPAGRHILKSSAGTTFTAAEIVRAITTGGTLFVASEAVAKDMRRLAEFIGQHAITSLILTASSLRALLALDDLTPCRSLRSVVCIGEPLQPEVSDRFFGRLNAEMWLGYGCTEAPGAAGRSCAPGDEPGIIDVGKVTPSMEVLVLDANRRLAPIGVPGEVYVGGQVARGYLGDPAATAARFLPHPLNREAGARVFRSGDLGRWLPTGHLEMLGRADDQVKIRGWRVELGEVESVLRRHPHVQEAAAMARDDGAGGKLLVAYVVPKPDQVLPAAELRRHSMEYLSGPMVPSFFVPLNHMPMTPNGKIDRRMLPELGPPSRSTSARSIPANKAERELQRIWSALLPHADAGPADNFFHLGGNSLLAARMLQEVEHSFGRSLPLTTLLQMQTIEELAAFLQREGAANWRSLMPIRPGGSRPPLYLIHGVGGTLLFYKDLIGHLPEDQPIYGLQAAGLEANQPVHDRVERMAAHYIREIQEIQPNGPYHLAGASFGGEIAYEMACQLTEQGQTIGTLALLDTYQKSSVAALPRRVRWRTVLLRIRYNASILLRGAPLSSYVAAKSRTLRRRFRSRVYRQLPAHVRDSVPIHFQKVMESNRVASQFYRPRKYSGVIHLFRCRDRAIDYGLAEDYGWREWAHRVVVCETPGDHVTFLTEPHAKSLANKLDACLRESNEPWRGEAVAIISEAADS